MKRGKNKRGRIIHRKELFVLPLTIIIGLFLLGYMGKITVELISSADFANNSLLSKVFSGNENEAELGNEIETENGETTEVSDKNEAVEELEDKEEVANEENPTLELDGEKKADKDDLKKEAVTVVLEDLFNIGAGNSGTGWTYEHDETGGTLRLSQAHSFTLQNKQDGLEATTSVPIHIIVEEGANNSNITLNNINISRSTRINSSDDYLAIEDKANAPFFIEAENITITLAKNTTNDIDATDDLAKGSSQRSAIYQYAGTAKEYTLNMTGSGKLICEDAGINTYASETGTSNIVITSGDIEINVMGLNRSGIGSSAINSGNNFGNLNIEILGGNISINSDSAGGAGIGTASRCTVDNLAIVISGESRVLVIQSGEGKSVTMNAAGIGTGGNSFANSLLIEINGNSIVEVKQVINADQCALYGAIIGTGYSNYLDATINLKGGQIKVLQTVNANNLIRCAPSIGEALIRNTELDSTMNINISGDVALNVSGCVGIGSIGGTAGLVKVNISKDDDGNVPNLLIATTHERGVIFERNGTGTIGDGVKINHLDLGGNRTGTNWTDWDDEVEKTLQIVTADNNSVLREVTIPGNVRSVAYTLPKNISTVTDTNVKVSFTNDGKIINRNFINAETGNNIIIASNNLEAISVIFDLILPALRTLYEGRSTGGSTWNYTDDETGGTLYLTGTGDFVLKNLKNGDSDDDSVPIRIIVEEGANNSNITFNKVNISRPERINSQGNFAVHDARNALIFIEAENVRIRLADGTKNIINAKDSVDYNSLRSAIYVYGDNEAATYVLDITGNGELIVNDAGINMYIAPNASKGSIDISSKSMKVNVLGTGYGIGGRTGTKRVDVNIKKNGNITPEILVASNWRAISVIGSVFTTDVMLSHLDLGLDRSGSAWNGWDDGVEKTLQIKDADNDSELRNIKIPGGVEHIAYTLPSLSETTNTNVFVKQTGEDQEKNRNFFGLETKTNIIKASNAHLPDKVVFDILIPALRTLTSSASGGTWNYKHDETGGTLYLTDKGDFVLKNLESSALDTKGVPIHIIVEKAAGGSNITFNNLNIKRAESAKSTTPFLSADSELIAPFMIKDAATVNIILAEGSENIIDGEDSLLEKAGYRTAIYMHAPTASTYILKIGRENPVATTPAPRLTTLNGGINALGVEDTNINMQLKDSNYDLNAVNNNYEHAVAFGSGYTSEKVNSGNYNLMLEAINENSPMTVRALGNDIAVGHNGSLSSSTTSVKGKVNLQAIAFTDGNAVSGKFDYSAVSFTTTLNKVDDWKSIVMHPYSGDELITNNFWELDLPETSFYPTETEQNVSIAYSNPEFDTVRGTSPFERMAMRIQNGNNDIQFLANSDGTGSTTAIISPNNEVSSRSNMLPASTDFEINIPKITLETNLLERTFTTPESEVRDVTNDSALPLALAFAGSTLDNVPAGVGIDNFAKSRKDFAAVNGTEISKLLLELNINQANNGDINFDEQQTQTLIPRSNTPEAEDYVNIVTLRGAHDDKISAVDLSVTGMYTEAASKSINGDFTNTVHLKFSLLDFAEFN